MSVVDLFAATAPLTSVEFAELARIISRTLRGGGLSGPSFRCPPRVVGVDRALRRRGSGGGSDAVVSVRVNGRARVTVIADMIEGVIAAHRLTAPSSDRVRARLWDACGFGVDSVEAAEDDIEEELDGAARRVA